MRSSASMRWMGSGFFLPPRKRKHRQRAVQVPAPPAREHRRGEHGLGECRSAVFEASIRGAESRGKLCCRPEREHEGVVVGGRLQLEVEGGAESLAQGQAEGPVDPAPERGVHDELHAAGFVEEALEDDVGCRSGAPRGRRCRPRGSRPTARAASRRARKRPRGRPSASNPPVGEELLDHGSAQSRDLGRQLCGTARRFSHPERDGRVGPFGVDHPDRPARLV